MVIRTKKYQLKPAIYIKMAMKNIIYQYWWVWSIPISILLIPVFYLSALGWSIGIAVAISIVYILFWLVQFAGLTQIEQTKVLFKRLSYEIDENKILIKLNPKQGMPIAWNSAKKVLKKKDGFLVFISKFQFIYLPYVLFRSESEMRRTNAILVRKGLLRKK